MPAPSQRDADGRTARPGLDGRRRRAALRGLAAALCLSLATGCATYSDRTRTAREHAQRGDLAGAERQINKVLKTRDSKDMPTKWKRDTALALLERGMLLHARGQYKLSARDLSVAEKQLELLDIARDPGQIGKWIFSDSSGKYHAPPSEKLVLNAYNLLNYLLQGDLSGARVEAKRFTIMHEYLAQNDPVHPHGAFGSYLAGFVFERLGEHDSALRYYDEALQARPFASLNAPIRRLAALTSYRSERIDAALAGASTSPPPDQPAAAEKPAEILVVASVGRVPYKIAKYMPIGAAIGLAHNYITGDPSLLYRSALKVVIYPELTESRSLFETADVRLDGQPVGLEVASDIHTEVVDEHEALKPKIIGAAITRLIVRAAAAEGARAAGNASSKKDGAGALIGMIAALATEAALVAADRPDTRSWTLLPARVLVNRIEVAPGPHTVTVAATGPGGTETRDFSVDLAAGGYTVIDVTTLR
jgi:tetratricopeptide (TPR) repeat protein